MPNKYEWLKEVDYNKIITGDLKNILEIVGIDSFIKLYEQFCSTSIYFSEKFIFNAKREYIKNNPASSTKELARKLMISEWFVQVTKKNLNKKKVKPSIIRSITIDE